MPGAWRPANLTPRDSHVTRSPSPPLRSPTRKTVLAQDLAVPGARSGIAQHDRFDRLGGHSDRMPVPVPLSAASPAPTSSLRYSRVPTDIPPPSLPPPAGAVDRRSTAVNWKAIAEQELRDAEAKSLQEREVERKTRYPVAESELALMVGSQKLELTDNSGTTIQAAKDRFRRAEAERDLLTAEHEVLKTQLADTKRQLGAKVETTVGSIAATKAKKFAPLGGKCCKFYTSVPVEKEDEPDMPQGIDSDVVRLHTELSIVEMKLAKLNAPLHKRMKFRPVSKGTRPLLTDNEDVEVRKPIITEEELAEETALLERWKELRDEFDALQVDLDAKSTGGVVAEATKTLSSLRGYFMTAIAAMCLFAVYLFLELEGIALISWGVSALICFLWQVGCSKGVIPLWLSILMGVVLSLSGIIALMVREEAEETTGVLAATPLILAAAWVVMTSFASRDSYAITELNSADNDPDDEVFKAVIEGDLGKLQSAVTHAPWRLRKRDAMTATPLHCALLRSVSSRPHTEIMNWILNFMPYLSLDVYTDKLFEGVACQHYAIIHRDKASMHRFSNIVPHTLTCRTAGSFFEGKQSNFGEWPIMFAVCSNQPDVVAYLLKIGAERLRWPEKEHLAVRDKHGNTLLHMCVYHNLPQMYDYIQHLINSYGVVFKEEDGGIFNIEDLTPFTLAAQLGHQETFEHLVETATDEVWQIGSCRCRRMWLDEVDPIGTQGRHIKGVLQLLVDHEQSDLLMIPAVKELLMVKWQTFAERLWLTQFGMLMVFVLAYSVVVFYGPLVRIQEGNNEKCVQDSWFASDNDTWLSQLWCEIGAYPLQRFTELFVLAGTAYRVMVEVKQFSTLPTTMYFGKKGSMLLEQITVYLFVFCVTCAIVGRMLGAYAYEDLALAIGALALWAHVLHELLGFRGTGPFVVMIWKMLGSDLIRFLIIFAAFLMGFTQALYLLVSKYGAQHFLRRMMGCFVALLGQADVSSLIIEEDSSNFPIISTALLLIYVLMVSILLLNLLIAMMTTTYSKIYDESDKVWNLEWARLILAMESRLSNEEKNQKGYKYWGEIQSEGNIRRFFLLPSAREEDRVKFYSKPPTWPPDAPHSIQG
eukprot:TRINITY_DN7341_c0_g2_i1.p1 TRINITY_DN7341_c0_g2~~TRINITY_DN7341_c0_g2_i1.p1  ORF type:complete len:1117 (+),score=263.17 TRINITY_DN7341_c0_g2_i1:54-3353(+)